ncbi:MAG: sulfatase-like hydrolase/transferase, partial [Halioglobus sp.]|nr:sulfatase-like hydrolase/transferase [Halioglobus sp.]
IFTSDNGGLRDSSAEKAGHYSPGRLRGAKGGAYEGGHRVPFIIAWPGHTTSGSFHHALISGADLVATLADLLQVSVGAHQARDSWSFLPLIKFEEGARTRSEMLIQSSPKLGRLAYRHGKWKLIFTTSRRFDKLKPEALYHLTENPREDIEKNLLRHPDSEDRVAAMTARATELVQRRLRSAVPKN